MAMQRTLDPGWPPLTQGRCLVHSCGPMPRILHTCRRMASVSARGVCVCGGGYHSRGHGESQEMWYLKDWGRNPHPGWRGIERGWVLASRCRASSILMK